MCERGRAGRYEVGLSWKKKVGDGRMAGFRHRCVRRKTQPAPANQREKKKAAHFSLEEADVKIGETGANEFTP